MGKQSRRESRRNRPTRSERSSLRCELCSGLVDYGQDYRVLMVAGDDRGEEVVVGHTWCVDELVGELETDGVENLGDYRADP